MANQEKKFGKNSAGQEAAFFVDEQEMTDGAANTFPKTGGASVIPTNYAAAPLALTQAGTTGEAIATGARYISIGVTVAATGTAVLIAFGTSAANAEANVSGIVASEVGAMLGGGVAGDVYIVGIPTDPLITHFSLAENHAVPTGVVMVSQGV